MSQVVENIRESWILRAVVVGAVASWLLAKFGVGEAVWTTTLIAGFFVSVIALALFILLNFSSIEDRIFITARIVYTLGPCCILLLGAPLLLRYLPGPAFARDLQFFLLIFSGIVWYQISTPFVRSWMRDSPNAEKLLRIEQKLSYRGTLDEIMDVEPFISTRIYYAFVAGLLSFILVFFIGIAGFVGSVLIAVGSAVAIYPIHKRVSHYLKISDDTTSSSIPGDLKLAAAGFWRGLHDWSKFSAPNWYLVLSAMILIFAVIFVYRVVLRFVWL